MLWERETVRPLPGEIGEKLFVGRWTLVPLPVEVGQDAAIKVDTFNFTRYGLLHGKVFTISHDAITRDKPQDKLVDKPQGAETEMNAS